MFSSGGGAAIEDLVAQVKDLQRNDPNGKEQWVAYVEQSGSWVRDPSKHDASFLHTFLEQHRSGFTFAQKMWPGGAGGGAGEAGSAGAAGGLAEAVKIMQKRSGNFKQAWASFCAQHGGGRNDPKNHDDKFLTSFLDALTGGAAHGGGPPAKRMRADSGNGWGTGGFSADPMKDALVANVKAFQRMGEEQKNLWGQYADTYLGGVRDPTRHDAATLDAFCQENRVPDAGSSGAPGGLGGSGMPFMSGGMGGGMGGIGAADPQKTALVERIKGFQKQSEGNKEVWGQFAGQTRDPNRHEVAKLQEFCKLYGL